MKGGRKREWEERWKREMIGVRKRREKIRESKNEKEKE